MAPSDPASRIRIKFCGITRPEDAVIAARLGVDAIGLVFYPASPRAVDTGQAQAIISALPPFVTSVGLFVDAEPAGIEAVLAEVPIDLLQFHGNETPADCERYGKPYIKVVAMHDGVDLHKVAGQYAGAKGLLLDTFSDKVPGGSGQAFDWRRVPEDTGMPVIVAGGLEPANVAEAIRITRPWGVDVSGGIESAKGIKDAGRMAAFIRGVKDV